MDATLIFFKTAETMLIIDVFKKSYSLNNNKNKK